MLEHRSARPRSIAVLSIACRFPGAGSREELWSNVLAGRRAFRAIPPERLDLARYQADLIGEADSITRIKAGLLSDWQFDSARFRIPKATFDVADLSHWLALDVAAEAIERAGGAEILERNDTAVIVANTLTGEFSRAAMLRLRAPFLDELLAEVVAAASIDDARASELRRRFLAALRDRFPQPHEDSLAGGLANTIAGRVANYFDLHGGAYSVDAACASSLVAVANAADLIASGSVDAAVVGAVDLSLDPFELVGFSRNGALAADDMRVFDARSSGFWPGEGAAFTVLMPEDEARRRNLPVLAVLRGWGISTDGAGGFTRPSVSGQVLALQRAYERAAVDPEDVGYLEAHGTGTATGDPVEVRALASLRNGAHHSLPIGSIKANIGHTKAAAGFAGLIKTISALESGIVPPHVSCTVPHPVFREVDDRVRPAMAPESWRANGARLAGVSAFGFGGINAHLVVEGIGNTQRAIVIPPAPRSQDAELFAFAGNDADAVLARISALAARAPSLTLGEFADAAALCAATAPGSVRAAVVARNAEELGARLARAAHAVETRAELLDAEQGVLVARRTARLGFLFPGQASPSRPDGGSWARRFAAVHDLVTKLAVEPGMDPVDTRVAQPTIAAASLAALRILRACGIEAAAACGHSLGELTALAWAGAVDEAALLALAAARAAVMATSARSGGGMLRIAAPPADVLPLIDGLALGIACRNGPTETVVSGPQADIDRAEARARQKGLETTRLAASHAFHSAMMEPAAAAFADALSGFTIGPPGRCVWSTIAARRLDGGDDIAALLVRQLVAPVLFEDALRGLAAESDFLIEVGPGAGLARLARQAGHAAISVDAFADSMAPLLTAIGAAFVLGKNVDFAPLFRDRAIRPIDLATLPRFLASPCGRRNGAAIAPVSLRAAEGASAAAQVPVRVGASDDVLSIVRAAIAEETGFALDNIRDDDRFLDDLHLNSIAVARIVTKAARLSGVQIPNAPTEFANATARGLADGLIALRDLGPRERQADERIGGMRRWVRTFEVRWTPRPPAARKPRAVRWRAVVIAGSPNDRKVAAQLAGGNDTDGLLIWLGARADERSTFELFQACRGADANTHLAICHAGAPVAAFARSLALEGRFRSILVVERPSRGAMLDCIREELQSEIDDAFYEVRIDRKGTRFEPYFGVVTPKDHADESVTAADVVLVTGGAKGIGAECALRLASRSGAALILAGRSSETDAAVAATLERARAAGIRCRYVTADVLDAKTLASGVAAAARGLGPVTVLLHVAGVNEPKLFQEIDDAELHRLMAPKTTGLRAAIDAAGPRLRRVISFGSILGRMGLKGETHYAIANAWQSAIAEDLARARPRCSVLSLEWSIWNGAGMGHRLGSLERLARYGVDAIALDDGIDAFERLVQGGATGTLMVTSRFGPPSHVSLDATELPTLRFIDKVRVHYPGLELVVETELSTGRDPYLADHRIDGSAVLPAVVGLEAMAQVASALTGVDSVCAIEDALFRQAVVIPDGGALRIQILALAGEDGRVETAIRTEDDGFATDHMRATFVFGPQSTIRAPKRVDGHAAAAIDAKPLYGSLLFQGEAFRRLGGYSRLSARRIAASLRASDDHAWFGTFEAQQLILGDPALRDTLLHALQAAVPHLRVVPVSVERIVRGAGGPPVRLEAVEKTATADTFVFDIVAHDAADAVVESWQGVTFRAISEIALDAVIPAVPEIVAPYLERVARATIGECSIEVALVTTRGLDAEARRMSALAALDLLGRVFARGDGKPLVVDEEGVGLSIAHCGNMTLAVKADREIGCDIERVANGPAPDPVRQARTPAWSLTAELAASGPEPWQAAATRVWALNEVAVKQNQPVDGKCKAHRSRRREVVTFESAFGRTMTIHVPGLADGVVVAIGTSPGPAGVASAPASAFETAATAAVGRR